MSARKRSLVVAALIAPLFALAVGCAGSRTALSGAASDRAPAQENARVAAAPSPEPTDAIGSQDPGIEPGARRLSTVASTTTRAPELLARLEGPEMEPLPLVGHDVTVVVSGHRARVVLDLVFRNPGDQVLAGTLMVALPDRASPLSLSLFQGSEATPAAVAESPGSLLPPDAPTPEAALASTPVLPARWSTQRLEVDWGELRTSVVVDPTQGRQVYETVTRARVDPALAEWAGSGSYSARIYPIPAGGLKRLVFVYDQTLVPSGGQIQLFLPVPSPQAAFRRLTIHDLSGPTADANLAADGKTAGPPQTVDGTRTWTLGQEPLVQVVYTSTPRNPALLALAGADPAVPGTLVTLLHTPELPRQSLLRSTGRALVLLDTSASGREVMAGFQAELLRALLQHDDSLSQFALVVFDVRATLLTPGFVANTAEARSHYLGLVDEVWLEGATAFQNALRYVRDTPELQRADTVFLLSDGEITWGPDGPSILAREHPELLAKRWICYSFGSTPHNRRLFDVLTRAAGQTVHIAAGQALEEAVRAHRYPVYHLEQVRSVLQDEVIVEGSPTLIYPGQVLSIAVRVLRSGSEVRLVLRVDGRDLEVRVPLARRPVTDALAARAWAEIFVGTLLDEPEQREVEAIQALSRHFGLTNDHASLLVLDTDLDYERYAVNRAPLDFRQIRQTLGTAVAAPREAPVLLSGLEVPAELSPEAVLTLESLQELGDLPVWQVRPQTAAAWAPKFVLTPPAALPEGEGTTALYRAAQSLMSLSKQEIGQETSKPDAELHVAQALRTLTTIAETRPRDDQALRLTGYVLMEWGFYDEAEQLFGRVRERRPFEPQNALLEALAEAAQGKTAAAALRYEIVLGQTFPRFQDASRPVAARLYADLLRAVIRAHPGHTDLALWQDRLQTAMESMGDRTRGRRPGETPAGRLLLFWNLDDTDVDLHVREGPFSQVWYGRMASWSGGRLYWDNTDGLGPELYEHPRLSAGGFRVSVDYFGTSSVEGSAPAATLVAAFGRRGRDPTYHVQWYATVLMDPEQDTVPVMPVWRRP